MANRILKGLAVAAGTGLAMGFTSGRTRLTATARPRYSFDPAPNVPHTAAPRLPDEAEDEFLNIEPLLERVERLELRVEALAGSERSAPVMSSDASFDFAAAVADLERRVEENTRELGLLRERIAEAEQRMTASVQLSVKETRAELPALVEQQVSARVEDLRSRFTAEIEQSQQRTLQIFERTIDEKISSRIGSIEKVLAEQAGSIHALAARSAETDNNLQRLVSAIEKLCERAELNPRPSETRAPFEDQLHDAMRRDPVVPVLRTSEPFAEVPVPAPAFTGGETQPAKKSRFLFRNLIVAGFSLLASRLFR